MSDDIMRHVARKADQRAMDEWRERAERAEAEAERRGNYIDTIEQMRGEAEAKLAKVRDLAEKWRYKGEHGWGPWQEGYGPGPDDQVLDGAATELLIIVDGEDA